ncbi:MAG: flagellar hook-basal body complex protein FliE [Myxococcales bacterium FL481]|nr:MAG: flagellar hook-basal body complex protein FliE [Myxococcales bacterium FL481]
MSKVDLESGRVLLGEVTPPRIAPEPTGDDGEFAQRMRAAFGQLETATRDADTAAEDLVQGRLDIHEAMVTMEKADLMLHLGVTVRDKLLDAYHKLMTAGN